MNAQSDSQQLHTAGGAAITGYVHTGGGDFVGRDFIQHIREHIAITGDGNIVGDSNTVIRQEGGDYAIQIGQVNVTLSLEDLRRILDPRYGHESGRRDFYTHAPRLEAERYVNRPHEYDQLKTLLLSDAPTVGITTALRGAGGFGKTTLARVLCDDAEVQARFSDGILWATLGENPDVLARLREWVTALGGIISENAPTIPQLVNRLTDLLRDGAYLLLIDDVWDSAALAPFLCGGPRCAHLATTRNRATLPANVQAVAVDTMRPVEAVALLGYGAAAETPENAALQTLAQRLGHWPLLLGIINSVLREMCAQGASLTDALEYAAEGLAEEGLTVFDAADATDRARAVSATLEVSLKRLSPADRARYTELAIFPEDTDIPATAAARLWGQTGNLSAFQTKDLFRRLSSASLVQAYNAERQTVRLHDVVRVYLAGALGPEGYAAAHRALLDAYRQTVTLSVAEGSPTPWHTAPDDGYLYVHLAYHLDALTAADDSAAAELAGLFATDDWLQVRVAADDYTYDGYLADLEYVWRRAEETVRGQIAEGAPLDEMAECVRYALIRTTVNSLADNYDPQVIAGAVKKGLWSPARALSVAANIPDPKQCAKMHTLLLKLDIFTTGQREVAQRGGLAAARAIVKAQDRAQALAALLPYLSGTVQEQVLVEEMAARRTIEDEKHLEKVLELLSCEFTLDLQTEEVLTAIYQRLPQDVLSEYLKKAHIIEDKIYQGNALALLAPQLIGAAKERALTEGLITLGSPLKKDLLVLDIQGEEHRAEALASLAPHLTGDLLAEGLAVAQAIESEWNRAKVLTVLSAQLTGDLLAEGLTAALKIENELARAEVLAALAPQLTGDLLVEGLTAARAIENEFRRAEVLAALAPQLTGDLLVEELAAVRMIESELAQAKVLAALSPQLTEDLLLEELVAAWGIVDERDQVRRLMPMVPQLTGDLLAAAWGIVDERDRSRFLAALVRRPTEGLLAEVVAVTQAVESEKARTEMLAALAPQLTGNLLVEGLATARAIESEWNRAKVLAALAPQLTGALLVEGLTVARTMKDELCRAEALTALSMNLAGDLREQALAEALAAARAVEDKLCQANALAALIPQLVAGAQEQALAEAQAAARAINTEVLRGIVLEELDYRAKVLGAQMPIPVVGEEYRATILTALRAAENAKREEVLRLLADEDAFKPDLLGLTPTAIARIAEAVIDVCRRWDWV